MFIRIQKNREPPDVKPSGGSLKEHSRWTVLCP